LTMGGSKPFRCDACIKELGPLFVDWTGKAYAGRMVQRAIKRGELRPPYEFECADCQKQAMQYDHRDYNKPLDVVPVCRSCNITRGPAIPIKGYFAEMFRREHSYYGSKKRMAKLLEVVGVQADLSSLPGYVTFEDWLPFKDALLEWEARVVVA
jgi:hypothetical protein